MTYRIEITPINTFHRLREEDVTASLTYSKFSHGTIVAASCGMICLDDITADYFSMFTVLVYKTVSLISLPTATSQHRAAPAARGEHHAAAGRGPGPQRQGPIPTGRHQGRAG